MRSLSLFVLASVLATGPACKRKAEPPPATTGSAQVEPAGSAAAPVAPTEPAGSAAAQAGSATPPAVDPNADHIVVLANHKEPKPDDPVKVRFERFKVVKASFDPAKIEGGTATIEVDLASLSSASPKRDAHLRDGYFEIGKFATATIDVGNVKKKADKTFTADAKVSLHGVDKTIPVTFEVVEAKDDWIRIKAEQDIKRLDFKVGVDPKDENESVGPDQKVQVQLTLKKT
jgi:polyisoprenoid-binding protein YceI